MKKKATIIFIFLFTVSFTVFSQSIRKTDSLENLLQQHLEKDTIRVNLLNKTALIFRAINPEKLLKYAEEAGELATQTDFAKGKAESLRIIGLIYKEQGDYAKALEYYQKSLKIIEGLDDKKGLSHNYVNIGLIYSNQGDYAKAMEYYQKSLKISIEIGTKALEAYNYHRIGSLYLKQKKAKEAYNYSKKAFLLAEEIGSLELLNISSRKLAKSCEALGLYKEAYEYYVVFKTMNDSLFNEENIRILTSLEYKYKYEKEKELLREKEHLINIKLKNEENIKYFLFVISIIMLAFVVFIIISKRKSTRFYKNELRLNKKIKESEIKLLLANKKLLEEQSIFIVGNVIVFKWQNKEGWPVEYVSQNVSNVFGYTSNDFLSGEVSYANLIHKDDIKTINEEINYSIANNLNYFTHNEYRVNNKAGEEMWLYDFTTIIRNSANEVTHFYGYVMNVTDRKKAEKALVIAKQKLNEELGRSKRDLVSTAIELSTFSEVIINSLKTINKLLEKHSAKNISEDLLNVKKELEYQLKK